MTRSSARGRHDSTGLGTPTPAGGTAIGEPGRPIPINDLRSDWLATDPEARDAVTQVLASGWYVKGPEHDLFETELAEYLGTAHAVALASGTDALVMSLLALGCGAGSEVVTAANAGGYSSIAAAQIGARATYADVDPTTLLMTAETVLAALGDDTRAVIVTHLYGNVADTASIVGICRARGVRVVEDCAQAIGGEIDNHRVGTVGDVAALSFYPTKNLGAAGDGGAIATNDPLVAERVRSLRQYGWDPRYVVVQPEGRNSRLDEIQAAVLRIGLRRVDGLNARRQEIVHRYARAIDGPGIRLVTGAGCPTVAHLAVIRAKDRADVRTAFETAGIATAIHYPVPDHRQPGLPRPIRITPLPETESAVDEILTIPCYPSMSEDAVARVCAVLAATSVR